MRIVYIKIFLLPYGKRIKWITEKIPNWEKSRKSTFVNVAHIAQKVKRILRR